ncbi:cytochrome P450 2C44-like isoform X2 [Gracilinanus agilis]|uniref:cytochrome P450 2C44-like isoform X2 n=1 Tax=Gracilinanus agilis TaxID=191870 RepID=UPI001CFCF3BC|nr:cytochrome P450 2C44-like isoform X2 [Gracilinanus agilis]
MEPWALTTFILVVCVSFLVFLSLWRKDYKGRKLPPGPVPLPIVGNMLQLDQNISRSLCKLSEKYGPVYTVYFGSQPVVVLHGYKALKEALIDQGDIFGGRGYLPIVDDIYRGHGIVFSHGEKWKQIRRFSLMTLRNFGMGKRSIEERVQEEAQFLLEELRKTNSQPFDPTFILGCAPCNVISSILFHQRFNYDDEKFLSMLRILSENVTLLNTPMAQLYNNFPWFLRYFPGPHKKFFSNVKKLKEFILNNAKKYQQTLDPNNLKNYIDCFLHKMQQDRKNPDSVFDFENLATAGMDLFDAGTETTSTTLRYGLLLILKYPEVQKKIHEEIDRVIGPHRIPSIKDKLEMPYTEAVLHEIQRFVDLVPFSLPHEVTQDTQLQQYFIPKGTTVYPLLSSVLSDPKEFPNPEQFDPGHFLNKDGSFKKSDYFMPFSIGKRACLGEGLAKMELFLFLVTILQNFTLKSVVDSKEIDIKPGSTGLLTVPPKFELCLLPR